ncbi:hypothetical protein O9G_005267 [Rozella allomycis CSF55]|uniref:Uncharacterized protein n=1 Tax=Rozella allomycis (strain CSF55) TaxID=988480 RepID=A0A075AZ82_ROZAC|nr:hypothetical protein O9G_005267 [Rozella allomycis CSF55]|eukprot:EPZ34022.1 hypothetical protein O9G_005267 [Rozella allomycis CSF55]
MHTFSGLEFQKDEVCKKIRISEMELQNLQENIREIKATLSTDNEMDKESKIMEIKALESIIHKTENAISVKRKELANIDILIGKEKRTKKTFDISKQEETRSVQKVRRGKKARELTKGYEEEPNEVEKKKEKDNNLKRMEAEERANKYLKMRHEKLELMKRERIKEIDKRRENKLKVELIMNKAKAKMLIDEFNKQEVSKLNLDDFININKSRRKKEREMRREKEQREEKLNEIATRVFGIESKVKLKFETEKHFNEDKTVKDAKIVNEDKNVKEAKIVKEDKNIKKEIGDGDAEEKYDDKDVLTKIKTAPVLGPAPLMYCRIENNKNKNENETLTFMPRQLIINEYEKETRVNKMISITNSSKESIVLKAIRVPLEVSDLLNIECNFPMTLHPGFSTKISLTFLNSEEEEISTRIILMAEYFSNKANLATEFQQHMFSFDFPKQINVGEVYLDKIKEFCIKDLKDVDLDKLEGFDINVLMKSLKFTIPETNKTLITPLNDFQFSLAAKELGQFKDKILISSVVNNFEGNEIEICGDCVPFDVTIENSKLDFGICHSKQDVTREFVIINNSLKMFFPFNGMIQPKGSLAVKWII